MVSFADVSVTDATAHRMLADYFAERAKTFPASQGAYRTTFPDPGQFVPPAGVFVLAYDDGEAGCGGIRELTVPLSETDDGEQIVRYEIKHLWVAPAHRGQGLGRAILERQWEVSGKTGESCIWPTPTKSGHIEPSTLKKQHKRLSQIASFAHSFCTRAGTHS